MKNKKLKNIYSADFETTTTEPVKVWCWTICNVNATQLDDVYIGNDLDTFMHRLNKTAYKQSIIVYFYNLKFDGAFIIYWLYENGFKLDIKNFYPKEKYSFTTLISDVGIIYQIKIRFNYKVITINCCYRLYLSKLSKAGIDFECNWKKTKIDYDNHNIDKEMSEEEKEYAKIDVLIQAELVRKYYNQFSDVALTIGGQALKEYKRLTPTHQNEMVKLNKKVDNFIRHSYQGGICYVNPKHKNKIIKCKNGAVYDYNSMYPSMMYGSSKNRYPIGKPKFFIGSKDFEKIKNKYLYIVRFFCRFEIKKNKLPCVSIGGGYFKLDKWCTTSEGHNVELYLCSVDYENFIENYNVKDLKIFDGYYFPHDKIGIADNYINHYYEMKKNNKGTKKTFAKFMLNSLTGKFGSRIEVKTKILKYEKNKPLYNEYKIEEKKGVYLPYVIFITAYARKTLCEAVNANYNNFIYCDTDSIHLTDDSNIKLNIGNELLQWKKENDIIKCKYMRPKCYIDKINEKDYIIKIAGFPEENRVNYNSDKNFEVYKVGATFKNVKLIPKLVVGGVLLKPTDFTIKEV